jgi:hypothetical protein
MLGFAVSKSHPPSRYLPAPSRRSRQSWRTFLSNQASAFGQYSEQQCALPSAGRGICWSPESAQQLASDRGFGAKFTVRSSGVIKARLRKFTFRVDQVLRSHTPVQYQRQRHRFDRSSRVVAHSIRNGLHHESASRPALHDCH